MLQSGVSRLSKIAAPLISLALLLVAGAQFAQFDLAGVWRMLPISLSFWLIFSAHYLAAPLADWIIFRRLWNIPVAGFFALVRKLIGNELLLGYVGELYFYSWARKRANMTGAPFGAVKDVAILSAVVGNCVTLAMLCLVYPLFGSLRLGQDNRTVAISIATVLLTSLGVMLWRKQLFSLPRRQLRFVVGVHLGRIAITTGLAAVMWHLILPGVSVGLWLVLATLRLLLSRLPFLPNKDVAFAGIAVFLIGHDHQIAALLGLMAGIIFATHIALGALLGASDLVGLGGRK